MRTKQMLNGRFEVTDTGEVYRIKNGQKTLATQSKTGRNRRYRSVSYCENGKQKHLLVHRLVAEAFVPNPDNLLEVNHIDGNPSNNRADNLEWCTRRENTEHAFRTGLINPYSHASPCKRCGEYTRAEDELCPVCKRELRSEAKKMERFADVWDVLGQIDPSTLPIKTRQYVELRMAGLTLQEVADRFGVSRQCVDAAIKTAIAKSASVPRQDAAALKEAHRLKARLIRKRARLELMEADMSATQTEIADIESKLALLGARP